MRFPFRLKLTLWYSGLLAAAVLLFSVAVYLLMARALLDNLNSALHARATQVAATAKDSGGHLSLAHGGEEAEGGFIPAVLITPSGRIIAGTAPSQVRTWLARHARSLRTGFHTNGVSGLQIGSQSVVKGHSVGYVLVWEPLESVNEARQSLLLVMLTIGPLLLLAAGVGGWALAGRALDPVVQVTEAASAISASDLSRRVSVGPAQDELGRLAATFNAMIDRLEAAVDRERRFTADASHELRSPLAVIRAETSLALEHLRRPDEYRQALTVIDEQVTSMEELIAQLLLLARLESPAQQQQRSVPLATLVDAAVEQCRLRVEQGQVRVETDVPETLLVEASTPLLTRAFRNVVDNAVRVSGPGDTLRIYARRENSHITLTIEDNGPGIPPEHLEHIFEPFYQGSFARTPGESHGLGLAICERIVSAHGGHVAVDSSPGQGTRFRIDLPAPSPPDRLHADLDEPRA